MWFTPNSGSTERTWSARSCRIEPSPAAPKITRLLRCRVRPNSTCSIMPSTLTSWSKPDDLRHAARPVGAVPGLSRPGVVRLSQTLGRSAAHGTVDELTDQVGMAVMTRVLLDHVHV